MFSHNDTQENNFLANDQETKILDFEYSCVNYRGADLASYILESAIDYSVLDAPNFKMDFSLIPDFNDPDSWVHKALSLYLEGEEDNSLVEEVKGIML